MGLDELKDAVKQTLRGWPVSNRLNRSGEGDDDASILEPIELASSVGD
jgi:hypothetical protein